ncbi:MAG: hypothetical protein R2751_02000 [Bacteroidales bacterium]
MDKMEGTDGWVSLVIAAVLVLLLNVPFGFWRAGVKRFSPAWFLAIHVPVPLVVALRFLFHLGFAFHTYVVLVLAFFLGQRAGGVIRNRRQGLRP